MQLFATYKIVLYFLVAKQTKLSNFLTPVFNLTSFIPFDIINIKVFFLILSNKVFKVSYWSKHKVYNKRTLLM